MQKNNKLNEETMFSIFASDQGKTDPLLEKAFAALEASYKVRTPKEKQNIFHPVFFQAIQEENFLVVNFLLNYININQYFVIISHENKMQYETTYLMQALEIHNEKIVKLLLEKGANVNAPEKEIIYSHYGDRIIKKDTPLIKAAATCPTYYAKLLIENKADVNATNEHGETALHIAAGRQAGSLVEFLIWEGSNVMAKTKKGAIPYAYAVRNGFSDTVNILGEHMSATKSSCTIL